MSALQRSIDAAQAYEGNLMVDLLQAMDAYEKKFGVSYLMTGLESDGSCDLHEGLTEEGVDGASYFSTPVDMLNWLKDQIGS